MTHASHLIPKKPACLYCHTKLAPNDVVEAFPFGARVAYDPERLRYWVVCKCGKWTIPPIEDNDRAVAIDQFERWWRSSSSHYSTGGIGLGRYSDRFSLVRIGESTWPEFAAWRHADTLRRRRSRVHRAVASMAVMTGAVLWLGPLGIPTAVTYTSVAVGLGLQYRARRHPVCRVPGQDRGRSILRLKHVAQMELAKHSGGTWSVNLEHDGGVAALTAQEGVRILGYALPHFNGMGANEREIQDALELVTDAGGPEALAARAAEPVPPGTRHYSETAQVSKYSRVVRAALEISTQEDAERRLLENELAVLRAEWREAEEIASIASLLP